MIDHVSLGTTRYPEARDFYQRVLAAMDWQLQRDTGSEAAFGSAAQWSLFLYPQPAGSTVTAPAMHLALQVDSRATVIAMHGSALAAAGTDLWGPRERPDIGPTYFGAMFSDLDGHRIEVLTHRA